ncbi:hypothetical protein P175DRAFT_0534054 [Aspergillus ochraceoroseus IBT 24754]|uniref:Glycosyl hydrolase family 13 catalytic domain-containing protein n=1 Tax=Aspergillus ochraceoroseus IBT 24754 TaxID=1392256 RepID=A0A2T5LTJ9_9EURO|nr:uncharacterized protein P175DRAFT_0534054 [Aspergillus ochraceoroseus IBT 24754]PTU19605.1 hypothetical protein P175DRAFT_0534054 [Aspergillus ochraceoroseus IBT 24754]
MGVDGDPPIVVVRQGKLCRLAPQDAIGPRALNLRNTRQYTYFGALLSAVSSIAAASSPLAQKWVEGSIYVCFFANYDGSLCQACDSFKYCGGSWTGIMDKLDYIQGLGFTAVQISPTVENIPQNTKYGKRITATGPKICLS